MAAIAASARSGAVIKCHRIFDEFTIVLSCGSQEAGIELKANPRIVRCHQFAKPPIPAQLVCCADAGEDTLAATPAPQQLFDETIPARREGGEPGHALAGLFDNLGSVQDPGMRDVSGENLRVVSLMSPAVSIQKRQPGLEAARSLLQSPVRAPAFTEPGFRHSLRPRCRHRVKGALAAGTVDNERPIHLGIARRVFEGCGDNVLLARAVCAMGRTAASRGSRSILRSRLLQGRNRKRSTTPHARPRQTASPLQR